MIERCIPAWLRSLELSVRSENIILAYEPSLHTLDDLRAVTSRQWLARENCGRRTINEIADALRRIEAPTLLDWESIAVGTERLPVPGGWIYRFRWHGAVNAVFVASPARLPSQTGERPC